MRMEKKSPLQYQIKYDHPLKTKLKLISYFLSLKTFTKPEVRNVLVLELVKFIST